MYGFCPSTYSSYYASYLSDWKTCKYYYEVNVGAIVGGIIGGLIGLALIILLTIVIVKKCKKDSAPAPATNPVPPSPNAPVSVTATNLQQHSLNP